MENIKPGERLGAYEIVRVISRGGMGVVYEALDTGLGRKVAIKTLADHLVNDAEMLSRFQREAKALASLSHPNIVGIHALAVEDGQQFLVLEYVEGDTISSILTNGPVPLQTAVEWMRQLTDAVKSAHDLSIIHRDIKPSNVLIKRKGGAPKLSDFGLAKGDCLGTNLTSVGAIIGTLEYIAPEIFEGRDASASSDIYSLGLLFYELLAGRCPFRDPTYQGGNYFQVLTDKKREPVPRLRKLAPRVPRALEKIIMKMCQLEPGFRYRNLSEVARELNAEFAESEPVAKPEPEPEPFSLQTPTPAPTRPAARRAPAAASPTRFRPEPQPSARRLYAAYAATVIIVALIIWYATARTGGPGMPERAVASTAYPPGTYIVWSAANRIPMQLSETGATGVLLQIVWSDIESRDDYRWADVDRRLEEAKVQGLKVAFALVTSLVHAPDSVRTRPEVGRVSILHRSCRMIEVPVFWDPLYHARKKLFIAKLGRRYALDESLVAVTVSFANFDSETWSLPVEAEAENKAACGIAYDNARPWLAKGLSEEKTLAIATEILDATAAAFPTQALKLAVSAPLDLLRSRHTVSQLVETAKVKYPGRLFLQINTLDNASPAVGSPKDAIYALLLAEAPRIGFQLRAAASTGATDGCVQNGHKSPCPPADTLRHSLDIALSYHPTFIEIAPSDATQPGLLPILLDTARKLPGK